MTSSPPLDSAHGILRRNAVALKLLLMVVLILLPLISLERIGAMEAEAR